MYSTFHTPDNSKCFTYIKIINRKYISKKKKQRLKKKIMPVKDNKGN